MKVGIFDPYLDDLGGGERYMLTIAEVLSKKHDVVLFWDRKKDVDAVLHRFSIDLSRVNVEENIFSPRIGLLEKLRATSRYDVIIFLSDGSIPLGLSKRLILHFQSPMEHVRTNLWTRYKTSRVGKIICNANFTKSFIDKKFGVRSTVLYPPVDIRVKNVTKENVILHVGRFRVRNVAIGDYKKQDIMVGVFKKMVENGLKGWRFLLAAGVKDEDREEFGKLQESAKGYPIEFFVNKTNVELWDLYGRAKIYWHASGYGEDLIKHPEYAEHFGIAVVEAMGAGAVPVVFNAGGLSEIVQDEINGLLWRSSEDCVEKTKMVMDDGSLWERLSKEAKKRATYFSKERFEKEIYEILR